MAPVILQGKRILQELCGDGVGWDNNVPEDIRPRWERWHAELPALEKLKDVINRTNLEKLRKWHSIIFLTSVRMDMDSVRTFV